jgi:hypothetical protein
MKAQPLPPAPLKRWRGPRVAVLALVLCSLLVPFAFLLFDRAPPVCKRSLAPHPTHPKRSLGSPPPPVGSERLVPRLPHGFFVERLLTASSTPFLGCC